MSKPSKRTIDTLNRTVRDVEELKQREARRVARNVFPPGGVAARLAQVTSLGVNPLSMMCRLLAVDGALLAMTGEPLAVQLFTFEAGAATTWEQLEPFVAVNSHVPIMRLAPRNEWYCVHRFAATCEGA